METLTPAEINAINELASLPARPTVVAYLARLMAHRPLISGSARQAEIILEDIAETLLLDGYAETAIIWALQNLRKGNSEFGGRNWPTLEEITEEINFYQRKINILICAANNNPAPMPPNYYRESRLDLLFDKMDSNRETI